MHNSAQNNIRQNSVRAKQFTFRRSVLLLLVIEVLYYLFSLGIFSLVQAIYLFQMAHNMKVCLPINSIGHQLISDDLIFQD